MLLSLRPFFGNAACKFVPSCTVYARMQLEEEPLLRAFWNISKRLLSCNPFF